MKTLLYTIFITLAGITYAQEKNDKDATESDYKDMAADMCGCVNKYANKISFGMRQAIIQAGQNPENMETIVQEQVMKDPELGMKDVEAIMDLADGMEKCGNDIDKKHKHLTADSNAAEVQQILIEIMKSEKGCEFTYALLVIGLREESPTEGDYYDEEYYDEEE